MTSAPALAALVILACCSLRDSDPSLAFKASEAGAAEPAPEVSYSSSRADPVVDRPEAKPSTALASMVDVRITAGSNASDRIAFEFADAIPEFGVEVPEGVVSQCDAGLPVRLEGSTKVLVTFLSARSHDDRGALTIDATQVRGRGGSIAEARQICDTDGEVAWAIGINGSRQFQVSSLSNPPRFVVDVEN